MIDVKTLERFCKELSKDSTISKTGRNSMHQRVMFDTRFFNSKKLETIEQICVDFGFKLQWFMVHPAINNDLLVVLQLLEIE